MYPAMYLVNLFLKYHELLITDIVNMPRNNVQADSRFQKAVEYLFKNPNLTIQDWDETSRFFLSAGNDKTKYKYMMVIRLWNKSKKDEFVAPPSQLISTLRAGIILKG